MKLKTRVFIFLIFSAALSIFLFAQDSKEEKKEEKSPVDEKKISAEIKELMAQFSKRNKIDILTSVKNRTLELDKQEQKIKTEKDILEKAILRIGEIVSKANDSDTKKFATLDGMLENFRKEIKEFDKKMTEEEETNLKKVIATFKEIKAKKAALIVPEMDMELVVKVLLALPARNAGAILQNVEPGLAAKISQRMAEERKKEELKNKGEKLLDNAKKDVAAENNKNNEDEESEENPEKEEKPKGKPKKIKKSDKKKPEIAGEKA